MLTPAPQLFLNHDKLSPDEVWTAIKHNNSNNNALLFSSNGTEKGKEQGHSMGAMVFAVARAVEVFDPVTGAKERLLKMRDMAE